MAVDESIVTWARTRGSMMKFFPVTLLTASAIEVMSLSLKFGVMRWPTCCCAPASEPATTNSPRKNSRFIRNTLLVAIDGVGLGLVHIRLRIDGLSVALIQHLFGLLSDLRQVQSQILLPSVAHHRDAGLTG